MGRNSMSANPMSTLIRQAAMTERDIRPGIVFDIDFERAAGPPAVGLEIVRRIGVEEVRGETGEAVLVRMQGRRDPEWPLRVEDLCKYGVMR
jgi:hypothetical protein